MRIESNVTWVPLSMRLMYPTSGVLYSVDDNDPVMAVQETYGHNQEGTGDRRYQVMLMPNGNVISAFWTDLGPASDFLMDVNGEKHPMPPYMQLVLMEHSVAECRYMAQAARADDFAAQLLQQRIDESDLFAKAAQVIEEDLYLVKNRSTFGRGGMVQRNGYSALAAREQHRRMNGY